MAKSYFSFGWQASTEDTVVYIARKLFAIMLHVYVNNDMNNRKRLLPDIRFSDW